MKTTRLLELSGLVQEARTSKQVIAFVRKKMLAAKSPVPMAHVLFDSVKAGELDKNEFFDVLDSFGAKFKGDK